MTQLDSMPDPKLDTVRIRLYYDFASTLCYVAHRVLTRVSGDIQRLGVELEWCPIDLTEAVPWDRGDSFVDEVRDSVRETANSLGIDVEMPDPWLDSRPASQIALHTDSDESEAIWRSAVFSAIFERGVYELDDDLLQLAQDLIGQEAMLALGEQAEKDQPFQRVDQSTRDAMALGVNGVPTFLLDNWTLGGVFDDESMVSIVGQLAEQYRTIGDSAVN